MSIGENMLMTSDKGSSRLGVSSRSRFTTCVFAVLISSLDWGQESAKASEDHQPSIQGIEVGMNAQHVLEKLGRMPDSRKDDNNEVVLSWKQDKGGYPASALPRRACFLHWTGIPTPRPTNEQLPQVEAGLDAVGLSL